MLRYISIFIYLSIVFKSTLLLYLYKGELLTAIPDIVGPSIAAIDSITKEPLDIHSSPSDIKKAYVKALRLVRYYIILYYY